MDSAKTGSFISRLRKEKGYTQKELADILNVSDKAVSRWETGKGFPDTALLKPLSNVLGISIGELLEGERFPAVEHKERTDQVIVKSMTDAGRKLLISVVTCCVLAVLVLVCCCAVFFSVYGKVTAVEFINQSRSSMYYPLGQVSNVTFGGFERQELSDGYVYYRMDGTERYAFRNTPEGPVMTWMHHSGKGGILFGFEIGEDTVIRANEALGLKEQSLRQYLEEQGFRDRYDLMMKESYFGRTSLVYIDNERCNWYPYTKDNVFINICISAYEGNRLMAFDIGLFDEETEAFCGELLAGFPVTLEDPQQLVTGSLRDTYRQWDKVTVTAKAPGKGETLYLYLNGQFYGKFNEPDPFHSEEHTVTFEMWGTPLRVRVTNVSPDA